MKKLIYVRPDGGVSVVVPVAKEHIERVLGPLTDEQYEAHVIERSIPPGVPYREIEDSDLPHREFRNAWIDVTPDSCIDIDCAKARDIALEHLRARRNAKLAESDVEVAREMEQGAVSQATKDKRQALRNATDVLKSLPVAGKVNDEVLLNAIRAERDKEI